MIAECAGRPLYTTSIDGSHLDTISTDDLGTRPLRAPRQQSIHLSSTSRTSCNFSPSLNDKCPLSADNRCERVRTGVHRPGGSMFDFVVGIARRRSRGISSVSSGHRTLTVAERIGTRARRFAPRSIKIRGVQRQIFGAKQLPFHLKSSEPLSFHRRLLGGVTATVARLGCFRSYRSYQRYLRGPVEAKQAVASLEPMCTPLQRLLAVPATSTVVLAAESTYDRGLEVSFSNVRALSWSLRHSYSGSKAGLYLAKGLAEAIKRSTRSLCNVHPKFARTNSAFRFTGFNDAHFKRPKINALNFITPSLSASSLLTFAVSSLSAEERTPETNN
ncbi:hypothetical protein AGLY_014841 [Aphis glycines]|uniref:Uncharacterized protein n=1 Tax=Aphis glycines TaxID=307491 RepID=A0A6G0T4F2_APHGL|nr:hypothetical protein AGLY_014841 [Aphis glycines]